MRSLDCALARIDQRIEKHLETFDRLRKKRPRDLEQTIALAAKDLRRRLRRLMRQPRMSDEEGLEAAIADMALLGAKVIMRRFFEADILRRNWES